MNVLKKKRDLLLTLCIAAMLISLTVLLCVGALPSGKNTAYAATEGVDCAVLTYTLTDGDTTYSVSGVDKLNTYNNDNSNNLKIVIPATHDGKPVTSIADQAFYNTSFTFKSVDFSNAANLLKIGQNAFKDCSSLLGELIIPNSVTRINQNAFYNCTALTSLKLGNQVTYIGSDAFSGCTTLSGGLIIPDSVATIDQGAFYNCSALTSLKLNNKVFNIASDTFGGCTSLSGDLIIPDSVTRISKKAFYNCSGLSSLKLGNQVIEIYESAFDNCSGLDGALVIPDTVATIQASAFKFCSALDTVYLPSRLIYGTYGVGVFSNVTGKIIAQDKNQYDILKGHNIDFTKDSNFTYETTVTFDANGGTISGQETLTQQKLFYSSYTFEKNDATKVWAYDSSYKFPTASRPGFKFDSYNTQADGKGQQLNTSSPVEDNKTYYAQYTENPFIFFEITNDPTKITYKALENFDPTGMKLTANFKDGSTQEVTDYTVVNGDNLQAGTSTVTVSVTIGGITLTKNISILVNAILVEKPTVSGTYAYSRDEQTVMLNGFDAKTMSVTGNKGTVAQNYNAVVSLKDTKNYMWSDYSNYDITLKWMINKATLSITPSYDENAKVYVGGDLPTITSNHDSLGTIKWDDYTLSAGEGKSFGWTWTPSSTNYNNVTGNVTFDVLAVELESISATFTQGDIKVFTSTKIDDLKSLISSALTVTGINNDGTDYVGEINYTLTGTLTAGTPTITVTFNGKTAAFNVTVTAVELESISAIFNQGDTKIYTSATLDSLKSYLTVTGLNNDGSAYTSAINYALTGTLTAGTPTITATFNGKTAAFNVTVTAVELESISAIFNQGETTIYTSGTLDSLKNMLTVSGINNDGTAYMGTINYALTGTLTAGTPTITATFNGKTATFKVTITATILESLAITTNPNKTVYTAFENFDKTGMVVTATFSHGTENISNFTVMGATSLQVGTTSLTISYTAESVTKTTTVLITVNKILLEKPTVSGNYTYNRSAQTVTLDGFDANTMEISGNTETNANTYDVVVTLSDKANYAWEDNTIIDVTLNWTIEKATYNISGISFTDKTVKENGNEHTLTLTGTLPSGVTVTYTGTNDYTQGGISLAGIYEITATFAVTDSDNYNMPEPMTATLTVNLAKITGTDNSSGSIVIITDGGNGIKPGTTVTVKEKPAADYKDADITLADQKQTVLQANDISLVYNGVTIQPDGSVTVRLLIKENLRGYESLKVVYIAPNGTIQDMNATRDGDYMVFTAAHFSLYAIVAPNNEKTVTPDNGLSGGGIACIVVASILVVLMLILLILFLLRKDKSQGFVAYFAGWFIKSDEKNAKNKNSDAKTEDETIKIDDNETTSPDDDLKE